MVLSERLSRLAAKWTAESAEYRLEAGRLESADRTRHAISIAILEARALTLDKCILELELHEKV